MKKIKIVTDSSCDLNKDIIEKYDIKVVPLNVSFGEDVYIDGQMDNKEFAKIKIGLVFLMTSIGLRDWNSSSSSYIFRPSFPRVLKA